MRVATITNLIQSRARIITRCTECSASPIEPKEGPLLETPKETPAYKEFQKELAAREAAVEQFVEQTGREINHERATKSGEYLVALYDFKHRTNDIARNAFMNKRGCNRRSRTVGMRS